MSPHDSERMCIDFEGFEGGGFELFRKFLSLSELLPPLTSQFSFSIAFIFISESLSPN